VFQNLTDDLPVGRAEVGPKRLTAREEKFVRNDVGECSDDVRVQLHLAERQLDVIGVYDNVHSGAIVTA
jgi:hypothetical protein